MDREAERDLPVLLVEEASTTSDSGLVNRFFELLLKDRYRAAEFQPDNRRFRTGAHGLPLQADHVFQCGPPMPYALGKAPASGMRQPERNRGGEGSLRESGIRFPANGAPLSGS